MKSGYFGINLELLHRHYIDWDSSDVATTKNHSEKQKGLHTLEKLWQDTHRYSESESV